MPSHLTNAASVASVPAVSVLLLLAMVIAFGHSPVAGAQEASGAMPEWFTKNLAREKKVRRKSKFSLGDLDIRGRMPGKWVEKPKLEDGIWYWSASLGTESPMECWLFVDPVNTAYALSALTDGVLAALSERLGKIQSRAVMGVDATHVDGRPILATDWLYTAGKASELKAGVAKMRAVLLGEQTMICAHNEIGYRQTAEQAFATLVGSMELPQSEDQAAPYFSSLFLAKFGELRVGFTLTQMQLDEDGDTRETIVDALLVPVDQSTLSTDDTTTVVFATPDGEVINALSATMENGELTSDLRLDYTEDQWTVSGSFQGKALTSPLGSSAALASELGQMYTIRTLSERVAGSSTAERIAIPAWLPDVDPAGISQVEVQLDKSGKAGAMTLGPIEMAISLDESGDVVTGSYNIGETTLLVEQVWQQGALPPQGRE